MQATISEYDNSPIVLLKMSLPINFLYSVCKMYMSDLFRLIALYSRPSFTCQTCGYRTDRIRPKCFFGESNTSLHVLLEHNSRHTLFLQTVPEPTAFVKVFPSSSIQKRSLVLRVGNTSNCQRRPKQKPVCVYSRVYLISSSHTEHIESSSYCNSSTVTKYFASDRKLTARDGVLHDTPFKTIECQSNNTVQCIYFLFLKKCEFAFYRTQLLNSWL